MYRLFILFLSYLIFAQLPAMSAEEDELTYFKRYGGFLHYQFNTHYPDFRELPAVPNCCPKFEDGSGRGFSLGALYEHPFDKMLFASARAYWAMDNGLLVRQEGTIVNENNQPADGTFEHSLDAYLHTFNIDILGGARLFNSFQFFLGFRTGLLLIHDYEQKEILLTPENGTFENGAKIRNNTEGTIDKTSTMLSFFRIGASYEFPLNNEGNLFIVPELFYNIGLNNVVDGLSWKINELNIGIAVKYAPPPPKRLYEHYYEIDTLKFITDDVKENEYFKGIEDTLVDVEDMDDIILTKYNISRTDTILMPEPPVKAVVNTTLPGSGDSVLKLYMKRYYTTEVFPLIPHIFFDKNVTQVDQRYFPGNIVEDFQKPEYNLNPVMLQRNILNIIGKRMVEYPDIILTLTGCSDRANEKGNCDIARQRAENVREYFIQAWSIPEERIIINTKRSKCYPEFATRSNNDDGNADNRRVELTSSDDIRLFEPIVRKRYLDEYNISASPNEEKYPELNHDFSGCTEENIVNWQLRLTHSDSLLYSREGIGKPEKCTGSLNKEQVYSLNPALPLATELKVTNNRNRSAYFNEEIDIIIDTTDIEVERMLLSYFRVSYDTLSNKVKKEVDMLLSGVEENTEVQVIGYTDYLGSEEDNTDLSANRAGKIAEYIRDFIPTAKVILNKGVADKEFPPGIKSYSTPEERFLSRTVKVEFKTILNGGIKKE